MQTFSFSRNELRVAESPPISGNLSKVLLVVVRRSRADVHVCIACFSLAFLRHHSRESCESVGAALHHERQKRRIFATQQHRQKLSRCPSRMNFSINRFCFPLSAIRSTVLMLTVISKQFIKEYGKNRRAEQTSGRYIMFMIRSYCTALNSVGINM